MKRIDMITVIRRIAVSMLAMIMLLAYFPLINGQSAYAEEQGTIELNEESDANTGNETGEEGGEDGGDNQPETPKEAYIDVQYDKATGIAVVSGDMRETSGSFYSLCVDGNRVYDDDVDINGVKSFEGFEIDMKEYSVGMHEICAVLYDENGKVKWYNEDMLYYENGVPTDIYSSQKPSIKTDYVTTAAKKMKYYYGGSSLSEDYSCDVFVDYKVKGGKWVIGKKITSTSQYSTNTVSSKLKPKKTYYIRSYFGKKGTFNGKPYFIKGKYSKTIKVKTGSSKKPAVKSIKLSKAKRKYIMTIRTTFNWGGYREVKWYNTRFKVTIKLKKKPGTTGICVKFKDDGHVYYLKGNKKKYTFTASLVGSKNYWKGRKKLYIYSYQSKKYEGTSPKASKKVRIK